MLPVVRKAADTGGTPTTQSSGLTTSSNSSSSSAAKTSERQKPLKDMRSRAAAGDTEQSEATEKKPPSGNTVKVDCTVKVRDDCEGHLICHKGDVIDQRCEFDS